MTIANTISDWLAKHVVLRQLRVIAPLPVVALFCYRDHSGIKPVAAYLAATGHVASSVVN